MPTWWRPTTAPTATTPVRAGAAFPVLHGASLDRPGSDKGGPYSEGTFPGGGRFSTVDVEDDGTAMTITIAGQTWDGTKLLSHTFAVDGEEEAAAWR